MTAGKKRRLIHAARDKKAVRTRKLASKFAIDCSYVTKILQEEGIKYYRRKKAPAVTPDQEARQIPGCRRLSREFCPASSTVSLVMDDESLFTLTSDEIVGNHGFYTDEKENTPPEVKYRRKAKFQKKLLVWLAVSEAAAGHSEPFFLPKW